MIYQETLDKVSQGREKSTQDEQGRKLHEDKLRLGVQSQMTNLTGFVKLIEFLDGHTTKAEITNHLDSIKTPDVKEVVSKLEEVKREIKNKDIDISPLQKCLEQIEVQLSTLPRTFPEQEKVEEVKVSNLEKIDTQSIVDAINALELKVDAPTINTEKVDLNPVQETLRELLNAVMGIELPKTKSPFIEAGNDAQAMLRGGALETVQTNILIDEKFDQYTILYDDEDTDDPIIRGVQYFSNGEKVAEVQYAYRDGRLTGARKV